MSLPRMFIGVVGTFLLMLSYSNCGAFKASKLPGDGLFSNSSINPSLKCASTSLPHTPMRRMNKLELNNSVNDLLGITGDHFTALPGDTASTDGFITNASFLKLDSPYYLAYADAIEAAVEKAKNGSAFKCTGAEDLVCAKTLLTQLARRAFRKKIDMGEIDAMVNRVKTEIAAGVSFKDALGVSYQRIFLSPYFFYFTASSGASLANRLTSLSPHELVTRLSYFLWNGPPDMQLLDLADQNKLVTYEAVKSEIVRMLKDPRAARFVTSFVGQWMGIRSLPFDSQVVRNGLTPELREDMRRETEMFASYIIQNDRSAMEFVSADYSFLNERLAAHYGISGVTGTELRKTSIAGSGRKGIMTQASVLTVLADVDKTRPTARGKFVVSQITCTPPPPFPPGKGITPFDPAGRELATVRERIELHSVQPACAGCHAEMDPIGLGLDGFDFMGRARLTYPENGIRIDTSGVLRNVPFQTAEDMAAIIEKQADFKLCFSKKIATYAVSRSLGDDDKCAVSAIGESAVLPNKQFSDLIASIVVSDLFRFNGN